MFYNIQNYIQSLSKSYRGDNISKNTSYKLPMSDAFFCAEDITRNKKFYQAIKLAVETKKHQKKGFLNKVTKILDKKKQTDQIVCVDAGAGTGLLGLYALVNGCDKVTFIEHNPYTMQICKQVVEYFGYSSKSVFLNKDATKITLSQNRDILISETIATDFITEDFHKIINNLLQYKKKDGVIIPSGFELIFSSFDGKNIKKKVFSSGNGFKKESIELKGLGKNTKMKINIKLYGNVKIKSGESMSLGNESVFDIENEKIILFEK